MRRRFPPPLLVIAAVLLAVFALLATLQYRWLGRIAEADRERRLTALRHGAAEFSHDIDRELTRAYLLFQTDPAGSDEELASRFAGRYDRWQASARFPKLLRDYYVLVAGAGDDPRLLRFDSAARTLMPADWPEEMAGWRNHFATGTTGSSAAGHLVVRRMAPPIWSAVPAVVSPMPFSMSLLSERKAADRVPPQISYSILTVDRDYLVADLLPSLAQRHFAGGGEGLEFRVGVFDHDARLVFRSEEAFAPAAEAPADLSTEFFRIRMQEFGNLVTEVRRFAAFATAQPGTPHSAPPDGMESRQVSILVQPGPGPAGREGEVRSIEASVTRHAGLTPDPWTLVLRHSAGSLDAAVDATRRRNLIVGSSILAILGASMGLLVLTTRRAQRLARQQMEFVAAVSHELRTPLAVIRSAADNLADGVVEDREQIRKYGELVRSEGRRLTDMVEQILELAGIQSGQRGFALAAVPLPQVIDDVVSSASALAREAGVSVEVDLPRDLPPILGDEAALRRLFQNLVSNAIKYGAGGGWVGITAARTGEAVRVSVVDRGMGIDEAEQARIFEPFYRTPAVVAAQIHGAGLGLSLVRKIAEAHGGRVSVRSVPGAGAEFVVELPAAAGAARGEAGDGVAARVEADAARTS